MTGTIPELTDASGFQLADVFEIYQAASLDNRRATGNHIKERFEATGFSFSGQLAGASGGSATTPSFGFVGDTNTGIYPFAADQLGIACGGVSVGYFSAAALTVDKAGGAQLNANSDALASVTLSTYVTSNAGSVLRLTKGRGSRAGITAVANADNSGNIYFAAMGDATTVVSHIGITGVVTEATPSTTAMGARLRFDLCPVGSVTRTELARMEHSAGLSMFGANPVINENRHPVLRSYTVATLPTAGGTNTRTLINVSDGTSNKRVGVSDGTNWRWPDGAIVS